MSDKACPACGGAPVEKTGTIGWVLFVIFVVPVAYELIKGAVIENLR
jgi:hypothetical protein